MVLRARTGSLRLEVVSLELRIAEIEAEKAAGSLRLRGLRRVWLGFVEIEEPEAEESEAEESESDAEDDLVKEGFEDREVEWVTGSASELCSESARSTGANSSAEGVGEGLE